MAKKYGIDATKIKEKVIVSVIFYICIVVIKFVMSWIQVFLFAYLIEAYKLVRVFVVVVFETKKNLSKHFN